MFRFLKEWREKRELRQALVKDLEELVVLNFFGELEEDYETRAAALEASYLERGLTRRDIERIRRNLGPVRISG